jgi:tight adherence protein B
MTSHALIAGILATFAVLCAAFGVLVFRSERRTAEVRRRLSAAAADEPEVEDTIVRDLKTSAVPFLDHALRRFRVIRYLDLLLTQAGMSMRAGTLVFMILCLVCAGAYLAVTFTKLGTIALLFGLLPGMVPLFVIHWKRQRRIALFERQFPDALDLMTSALRAGLAFNGALQVVAEESPDPIAREFRIVFEENRLGLDLRAAFGNLAQRIDSTELRLFITAVLLQRETGGNLSEILEGTADVIRDRMRILGDVRSITAQGRLSGLILSALPIIMGGVLMVLAPEYMKILITHQAGHYLLGASVVLQVVGYLAIRKIIAIKV